MALAAARLRGLRQWEVAVAAEIDPAILSRILNRERAPTRAQVTALATVLDAAPEALFPDLAPISDEGTP